MNRAQTATENITNGDHSQDDSRVMSEMKRSVLRGDQIWISK